MIHRMQGDYLTNGAAILVTVHRHMHAKDKAERERGRERTDRREPYRKIGYLGKQEETTFGVHNFRDFPCNVHYIRIVLPPPSRIWKKLGLGFPARVFTDGLHDARSAICIDRCAKVARLIWFR